MDKIAPTQQLLITEETITQVANKYFIKKKDIQDPRIIDTLRHLCNIADKRKDPAITYAIFVARQEILENACEVYALIGEDKLFDEHMRELGAVMNILEEHTITR